MRTLLGHLYIPLVALLMACGPNKNTSTPQNSKSSYGIELNDNEKKVNQWLAALKNSILNEHKNIGRIAAAEYYTEVDSLIRQNELFRWLRKMPKGASLHIHGPAMVDLNWVWDQAVQRNAYIYWSEDGKSIKGTIKFIAEDAVTDGFTLMSEAVQKYPDIKNEFLGIVTLGVNDRDDLWPNFFRYFQCTDSLIRYRPLYEQYYEKAYLSFIEDGVKHLEVRYHPYDKLYDTVGGQYNADSIVLIQQKIVDRIREKHPEFSLKLVYSGLKLFHKDTIEKQFIEAYSLKQKYPELVEGFDLVADEDNSNAIEFYSQTWDKVDSLDKTYGVTMPLIMHAGESKDPRNTNIQQAMKLNTQRIGHGFNLIKYPQIWDDFKTKGLSVEICPNSNQLLGYVGDLRNHPGLVYHRMGIPITISSDDPAPFGYEGVTPDFWSIVMAWNLDLADLKTICLNSLNYSSLSGASLQSAIRNFNREWDQFIEKSLPK